MDNISNVNDINDITDGGKSTSDEEGIDDYLDVPPPQRSPTGWPGHFSSTTSGEDSFSATSGEDSSFAVDMSPDERAVDDMDYMCPAPHEGGIHYGRNMCDIAADNMAGHIAAQQPEPPFQQIQQKGKRPFEVNSVLTDASNSSNSKRTCRNGLPLPREAKAKAKTGKGKATAGKATAGKSEADKATAAKRLTSKKNLAHMVKSQATLDMIISLFEAHAPDHLQALLVAPDVVLSRCDQLLNLFAVVRKSHKLMRKDWKIKGVEFGRQDSWPEMGIKSNRADSLLNAMIESLALMHKHKHVRILVNTESKESNTTWKKKRAALVELDRSFEIRSAIKAADVHTGIKTIAIGILNQIAQADAPQKV